MNFNYSHGHVLSLSQDLPRHMTLDGELFGGRGLFQSTVSIVKNAECDDYKKIKYHVSRGGIKIFKALVRLASNSKFLLAKSEKNLPKSCLC
jgi:hypothetical protein